MRAAALGVLLGALLLVASTHAGSAQRLRLVSAEPVVVVGTGFHSYERVRLLITPGPSHRGARAGRLGRFRVTIRASMPSCGAFVVQAFGSRGSRALFDRTAPDCNPID